MDGEKPGPDIVLAFVLLREPAFPAADAFALRLRRRLGEREEVAWDEPAGADGASVQFFHVGPRRIVVALMPLPVPWGDLEGPCATNPIWPEATEVCRAHKAHLVVAVHGAAQDHPISVRLLATHVVAALVEELGAPAVYWGEGTVVHSGDHFVRMAAEASEEDLPLLLWVDFRIWRQEDGSLYIATTGLNRLGPMEIEGASRRLQPWEMLEKVYDVAHYLCQSGPVLNDGDTVGASEAERIRVHHRPSVWDREPVIFLEFDGPEKRGFVGRLFGG